jgi:hypothetical protein
MFAKQRAHLEWCDGTVGLELVDLDQATRQLMLRELERDLADGTLYHSKRFTETGRRDYPGLLRAAILGGSDESLIESLAAERRFDTRAAPRNAIRTYAESEFNTMYIRAVCLRAIDEGESEVEIYRAKPVAHPREEADAMAGLHVPAPELLAVLRSHRRLPRGLGSLGGPNSGLSVRLRRTRE